MIGMVIIGFLSDYSKRRVFFLPIILFFTSFLYLFAHVESSSNIGIFFWWGIIIATMVLISGPSAMIKGALA